MWKDNTLEKDAVHMPGANLTRVEAEERAAIVANPEYAVNIDVTRGANTFLSKTEITFDSAKRGATTYLDLIASRVESVEFNGEQLDPEEVYQDSRIELKGLKAHNEVKVTAVCDYSRTGEGLHRSVDPSDGLVYLYTQFEVPDARRVYAVFDQPDLKATFDFSVIAPESWVVLANMPVKSCEAIDQQTEPGTLEDAPSQSCKRWFFETTPKMSSYLTAICAGPYAEWTSQYANEDGRTLPMGLYCRQALKSALEKDVDYLFDITKKGFAFYAKTWGVPYPYAKYDQIFVPEYNAGAMENIGLVTFRDQYIFESKATGAKINRRVETVLHELAHMWFGDLVTMKWWNDLWLNESFAEFMSTLATAETTEWDSDWATFCSGEKSWALLEDQLPTTHPIVAPINDLHDTEVNFDGITYAKGASVLKQLVAYVGRQQFFEGIHNYLEKHAYSNATLVDLLTELEATSGRDLKAWSAQWLEQSGINTLTTKLDTDAEGRITAMSIEQSASDEFPVMRSHRLAVGFYSSNDEGKVVRTDRFELDVNSESTQVQEVIGRQRPDFILINDDDLTYAKLRVDVDSLTFAQENLYRFEDPLARAVILLSFWDMTRDGEYPAADFVSLVLKMLSTEHQPTTFRYALSQLSTTAHQYTAVAQRPEILQEVAERLWQLAEQAEAGSDEQFQLVEAYLKYGDDQEFEDHVRALLNGSSSLEGFEIDNNMSWSLIHALASQNMISDEEIHDELAKRDTTENREFAMGARAARPVKAAKAWAWDQALHNADLTNYQIEALANGFSSSGHADLFASYIDKFFGCVDWVWDHKTFHIAETLLSTDGLYPYQADPAALVHAGDQWLAAHEDAPKALRGMVIQNVESSKRTLRVRTYNEGLHR
jgi:aminopeptidase N